jgi:O-antigen/teichoic acid export membrane protein
MSIQRQFGNGVAWMAAGKWIEQAINFAVFVLLARIVGAQAYGLLTMAAVFLLLGEALVRDSFSDFLFAFAKPEQQHYNAAFWMLAGLGGTMAVVLILAARPIAAFYGEAAVAGLIWALSPNVVMIALTAVPVAILRRELRFRTLALRAIAGLLSGGIVAVILALNGYGVWSLAAKRLVQVVVNVIMAWAVVSWRPSLALTRRHCRDVFAFGGTVLGLRAAELAATQVPSVIIGATLGPETLGFFSIAWRLVDIGAFLIVAPLRMAAQPAFATVTRSGAVASGLLMDISRLSGLVAFAAFAGLSVLAAPVVVVLFGPQWLDAAPIVSVLSVLGAYFCIEKIHQAYCLAAGRATATTLVSWLEVVTGALLVWLLKPWGIQAMAGGLVAAFVGLWVVRFYIVASIAQIRVSALAGLHILPLAGALSMAGVVWLILHQWPDWGALAQVAVGVSAGIAYFIAFTAITMPNRLRLLRTFIVKSSESTAPLGPDQK